MVDEVATKPEVHAVDPVVGTGETADEKQAMQVKKIPDDQRKAADKAASDHRKAAQEKHHADRLKAGREQKSADVDKLYIGTREVKIVRKAEPDDIGFMATEACSVVQLVDTGKEQVVQDADISTERAAF